MSINVTVTGNPVCIKRGKMVTADPKDVHKEFQKRRKMRLEQVRQQSKEIAESVRNKVRREKSKQSSLAEKQSATKFNEWQNTKLLELQHQYRESLKDIGSGHTQARVEEAVEAEYMDRRDKYNEAAAQSRGQVAEQQEQIFRNKENLKKALPAQRRRLARDVENARSAMVCQLRKGGSPIKKKKRRKKSLINVSIMNDMSESDSEIVDIVDLAEELSETSENEEVCSEQNKEKASSNKISKDVIDNPKSGNSKESPSKQNTKTSQVTVTTSDVPKTFVAARFDGPFDTRISDRIKNRHLIDSRILVDHPSRMNEISETSSDDTDIRVQTHVRKETINPDIHKPPEILQNCGTQVSVKSNCRCLKENKCNCGKKSNTQQTQTSLNKQTAEKPSSNLPSIPTVSLRSGVSQGGKSKRDYTRVQYYDHSNRFNNDYIIDSGDVQKISEDSIQVCVDEESEADFQRRGFEREKAAQMRGKRALEKQKIQRDYEDLMKKLPVLQKQERIAGLDPDKDKFHMSDKRLKDYEKNRQGRIEQAFEMLVPNAITIQPKNQNEREGSPALKIVDLEQAQRKSCSEQQRVSKNCSERENNIAWKSVSNLLSHKNSTTSHEHLRCLLEKLKAQKEILIQENNGLPENSNLSKLLSELEKCNRKTGSSSSSSGHNKVKRSCKSPKKPKQSTQKDVLVLQNTSTQTSPKTDRVCNQKIGCNRDSAKSKKKAESGCDAMCGKVNGKCICLNKVGKKNCASPELEDGEVCRKHEGKCSCKEQHFRKKHCLSPELKEQEAKCCCQEKSNVKTVDDSNYKKVGKCNCTRKPNVSSEVENETVCVKQGGKCLCKSKHDDVIVVDLNQPDGKCGDDEKICEIFIKIQDNEKPEIIINSPKEKKGAVSIDVNQLENDVKCAEKKKKRKTCNAPIRKEKNQNESFWREQLSKNDVNSTTSYYSPPDYSKDSENIINMLSKKPQQSNVNIQTDSKSQKSDKELLPLIKKLLQMSKGSIERLCVSSVSEVSTPSSSLIENPNNMHPAQTLINLLRKLNIDVDNRTRNLNKVSKNNQTETSVSMYEERVVRIAAEPVREKRNVDILHLSDVTQSSNGRSVINDFDLPENQLVRNITDITDKCQEKIDRLTEKIQSLRAEKNLMLSPGNNSSSSDRQNSAYLNLPSLILQDANNSNRSNQNQLSSRSTSPEQRELNLKLLQVNTTNTQDSTHDRARDLIENIRSGISDGEYNDNDADLMQRYVRLIALPPSENDPVPFVPVLMDIPKLPKLAVNSTNERKPPPSKGLRCNNLGMVPHELSSIPEADSIRRSRSPESPKNQEDLIQALLRNSRNNKCVDNGDLNALKTIPVIQSPRNVQYKSPSQTNPVNQSSNSVQRHSPPSQNMRCVNQPVTQNSKTVQCQPPCSPTTRVNQSSNQSRQSNECGGRSNDNRKSPNLSDIYKNPVPGPSGVAHARKATSEELLEIMKRLQDASTDTSTEKSGEMESVLKSLGMNWAVATLKKTQEALAQNSSSSNNSSTSRLASTSTDINCTSSKSCNSIRDNFVDVSTIHGSGLSDEKRQTSTPVQTAKSSRHEREHLFAGESELSSVKDRSRDNEWKFVSMPNATGNDSTLN